MEEDVKIILDMPLQDMGLGLTEVIRVMSQYPDQEVGREFAVVVTVNQKEYEVIRNINSYSIRRPYDGS